MNVASRIQSLGIANSILFSSEINTKGKTQQVVNRVLVLLSSTVMQSTITSKYPYTAYCSPQDPYTLPCCFADRHLLCL